MKKITLASLAALVLSATIVACKKTDNVPVTQQSAATHNWQSVMKPYVTTVANHRITGIKATPKWDYDFWNSGCFTCGDPQVYIFNGCSGNSGQCITKVEVLPIVVPGNPDDSTAIAQNDYSALSADFIGGNLFETADSTKPYMFIFEQNVSNVDQYFDNPAAIIMNDIPLEWPADLGGYKERIKAATRTGRIITKNGRRFLEIFIDKSDIDETAKW